MGISQISVPELDNLRDWLVLCSGIGWFHAQGLVGFCAELVGAEYVSLALASFAGSF